MILSNDSQNKHGLRVIAAPITTKVKNFYPYETKILLKGRECKVLLNQIRALDKLRIDSRIATIDSITLFQVEETLRVALDLKQLNPVV